MDPDVRENIEALKRTNIILLREVATLKAAEHAYTRLLVELIRQRAVSFEAASILAKFPDWRDEHLTESLLALEREFPSLAAELARGHQEPFEGEGSPLPEYL